MGMKLSHRLIDLGFFSALGTSERSGLSGRESYVKKGKPFSYDYNNGVSVAYDEDGRPWILHQGMPIPSDMSEDQFRDLIKEMIGEYRLKRGAFVPHSNDGGYFVRTVIPEVTQPAT